MLFSKINSKSFLILLLIPSLFFISCNDSEKKVENEAETVQEATLEQKKQALENVAPTQSSTNTSGNVAINPAHGQPGHDCAVPVGAPLTGSGSSTITPKASPIQTNNAVPAQTSGGGNLNPAHGQPGHRCDIKVGDPL